MRIDAKIFHQVIFASRDGKSIHLHLLKVAIRHRKSDRRLMIRSVLVAFNK